MHRIVSSLKASRKCQVDVERDVVKECPRYLSNNVGIACQIFDLVYKEHCNEQIVIVGMGMVASPWQRRYSVTFIVP